MIFPRPRKSRDYEPINDLRMESNPWFVPTEQENGFQSERVGSNNPTVTKKKRGARESATNHDNGAGTRAHNVASGGLDDR